MTNVCNAFVCRESEDTVLLLLKEIYSLMGITTTDKSSTADVHQGVPPLHQPAVLPYVPPGTQPPPFRPPAVPPHMPNGSSGASIGSAVPMYGSPTQMSSAAIGGPLPGTAYIDPLPRPPTNHDAPSPAVGPPPRSGFVRK